MASAVRSLCNNCRVADLYRPLLAHVLYPAWELAQRRPTLHYLAFLNESQWWSRDRLQDWQTGQLRRLVRHAYAHTPYYREAFDQIGLRPNDIVSLDDLQRIPLLTRERVQASAQTRRSTAPPFPTIVKNSSGTTGAPTEVAYDRNSQDWRDAVRWRGYGWAGYQIGDRALHYWGAGAPPASRRQRYKIALDRKLRRNLYIDSSLRTPENMRATLAALMRYRPHVIVAFTQAIAALARFVQSENLRMWDDVPVIVGAERLWPHDREAITAAFGPVFETYGSREVMLMGAECEAHEGMHLSMETQILELVVTQPDGAHRQAAPGEIGEVAVTDLQNLGGPLVRYLTGDRAVARAPSVCPCGRALDRIGPIEGRTLEMLYDAQGNEASGILVSIMFLALTPYATGFQVIQRRNRDIVVHVVPRQATFPPEAEAITRTHLAKYLPGVPVTIVPVAEIPLTRGGKLRLVINEGLTPPS